MHDLDRRRALALLAGGAATLSMPSAHAQAPLPRLILMTAGQGSAFLPYGQGIAQVLARSRACEVEVRQSKGSNENLGAVNGAADTIGTAFLGSAFDALNGKGFAAGHRHDNIQALFPMYETAFMAAALASSNFTTLRDLQGKRVGCGPANGPAEGYFRAAAEIAGIAPVVVSGEPAAQARQLVSGEIDAFWQGASVPIPSLVLAANAAPCNVFGLTRDEVARMRERFPFMTDATYPPSTYRGQTSIVETVAAWNVVVANRALDENLAYAVTKAVLTATNLPEVAGAAASATKPDNARRNAVVPYHPGAMRALAGLGVTVP